MKLAIVLFALSAASAYAASPVGGLSVNSDLENGGVAGFVAPQFQIEDNGSVLSGASGETVYLERQAGGYKGFVGQRPFDITCNATSCTDGGSTQLSFTITPVSGGYKLEGSLNFVSVDALVTSSKISVSAMGESTDESFSLNKQADGSYTGQGTAQAYDTFQIEVDPTGSLASELLDPATFIVLLVSPIVGN